MFYETKSRKELMREVRCSPTAASSRSSTGRYPREVIYTRVYGATGITSVRHTYDLWAAVAAYGGGGFHCFRLTAVVCLVYACYTGHTQKGKRRLRIPLPCKRIPNRAPRIN